MIAETEADRLDRDELSLLQQRALRSWRQSDWLARERPREYVDLEEFPEGEVWVDIGGGIGESQQETGAIVLGSTYEKPPSNTGESRSADLEWFASDHLPMVAQSVDQLYAPEGSLRRHSDQGQLMLLREFARVLRVGGSVTVREDTAFLRTIERELTKLGFTRESKMNRRADRDGELTMTLTDQKASLLDIQRPLIKPTVNGVVEPQPIRTPR